MSSTELRRVRAPRHLCQRCRDRKARFKYRGVVRADHDHTLCFECYRSELNQARARRLCVFRDSAFADDVAKTNLAAILQQNGLQNSNTVCVPRAERPSRGAWGLVDQASQRMTRR